jgi:hypothetical protein
MKKIYIILLVVVLFSGLGTVVFFVTKKKRDSKKNSSKAPIIEQEEHTPIVKNETEVAASVPPKPLIKESLEMDIKVPHVDVGNRRFDYSMHYKGIPYKGNFEEGLTSTVQVKKSFGSFVIKQRMNQEKGNLDLPVARNMTKDKKMRDATASISTQGGATGISGIVSLKSDWVDLVILDSKNRILKQLSVNLRTGETTSNAKLPTD